MDNTTGSLDQRSFSSDAFQRDFRLGLDLRIAVEEPETSYLVDAFMSQYRRVSALESLGATPLALTLAGREYSGSLRHTNALKKLLRWTLPAGLGLKVWESEFAEASRLGVWHQFAPVDKTRPAGERPSLITLLPAHDRMPTRQRLPKSTALMVPSHADREIARQIFRTTLEKVHVSVPPIRPFLFDVPVQREANDGWFLFIVGKKRDVPRAEKWIQILAGRYPKIPRKLISLESDSTSLKEENWLKILQRTRACFYFSRSAFDWAVPAFEAMYARIPTIFLDDCHAIAELLPRFPLSLPRFLLDTPEPAQMADHADEAFSLLKDAGVFDTSRFADETLSSYRELGGFGPGAATLGHA